MCPNVKDWYQACEFASFYASTVSLLPTHREETNQVVVRNRRIGVSIIDWTGWVKAEGLYKVTSYMRKGYDVITETNRSRNAQAGVPEAIRKTTIKPGGTTPKLPGKTPAIGYPTFKETLRRIRVAANSPICPVLDNANIPFSPDFFDPNGTRIYEYPTKQGPADPAETVSLWEQAINLVTVQREWADNAVSNTLYFKPYWKLLLMRDSFPGIGEAGKANIFKEEFPKYVCETIHDSQMTISEVHGLFTEPMAFTKQTDKWKIQTKLNRYGEWELYVYQFDPNHEEHIIEKVCSAITPLTKSFSLLPHSAKGAYRQMPEEGITPEEYVRRLSTIKKIDWTTFGGSDGLDEKFCNAESCEIVR